VSDTLVLERGRARKRVLINRHVIAANKKHERAEPPVSVHFRGNVYRGRAVSVCGPSTVRYSPDKPLNCGATVWIETYAAVEIER